MGVPTSEVGYTPAMPRREDHEVHKGHVVALEKIYIYIIRHTNVGHRTDFNMMAWLNIFKKSAFVCLSHKYQIFLNTRAWNS